MTRPMRMVSIGRTLRDALGVQDGELRAAGLAVVQQHQDVAVVLSGRVTPRDELQSKHE